jgi:hypothetical protein
MPYGTLRAEIVCAPRGAYHRDGQVVILGIEPERVLAHVADAEDYPPNWPGAANRLVALAPALHSRTGDSASPWSRYRSRPMS